MNSVSSRHIYQGILRAWWWRRGPAESCATSYPTYQIGIARATPPTSYSSPSFKQHRPWGLWASQWKSGICQWTVACSAKCSPMAMSGADWSIRRARSAHHSLYKSQICCILSWWTRLSWSSTYRQGYYTKWRLTWHSSLGSWGLNLSFCRRLSSRTRALFGQGPQSA